MLFNNRFNQGTALLLVAALSAPASAFTFFKGKWSEKQVDMSFNIQGSAPSGISYNQAVEDAVSRWNNAQNDVDITTERGDAGDACSIRSPNTVVFSDKVCNGENFGSSIAVAVVWSFTEDNGEELNISSSIFFDDKLNWDIYDTQWRSSNPDFRRVAAHEIGHVLGLGHQDGVSAIMNTDAGNTIGPQKDDLDGIAALYRSNATKPQVRNNLEEPAENARVSGVSNIRGWAVGLKEIDRIELRVDGTLAQSVPYGGLRQDVEGSFPDYPDSDKSGYSMIFNWANLSAGNHTMTTRAIDVDGNHFDSRRSFTVVRFDNPFISGDKTVIVNGNITQENQDITLENVLADDKNYRVRLRWNTATQQWDTTEITRK